MTWKLANVEQRRTEFTHSFDIPNKESRSGLNIGQIVKLIFEFESAVLNSVDESVEAERMWVEITKITPTGYEGKLDNDPMYISSLNAGDLISFGPENIAAIWED